MLKGLFAASSPRVAPTGIRDSKNRGAAGTRAMRVAATWHLPVSRLSLPRSPLAPLAPNERRYRGNPRPTRAETCRRRDLNPSEATQRRGPSRVRVSARVAVCQGLAPKGRRPRKAARHPPRRTPADRRRGDRAELCATSSPVRSTRIDARTTSRTRDPESPAKARLVTPSRMKESPTGRLAFLPRERDADGAAKRDQSKEKPEPDPPGPACAPRPAPGEEPHTRVRSPVRRPRVDRRTAIDRRCFETA